MPLLLVLAAVVALVLTGHVIAAIVAATVFRSFGKGSSYKTRQARNRRGVL